MGVPLSVARGARLPGDAWSPRDWALAQAAEVLDRTRCPRCGQPTWLSHDKANARLYKAVAERCFSCSTMDSKQKALSGDNVHNPGSIHYRTEFLGR